MSKDVDNLLQQFERERDRERVPGDGKEVLGDVRVSEGIGGDGR